MSDVTEQLVRATLRQYGWRSDGTPVDELVEQALRKLGARTFAEYNQDEDAGRVLVVEPNFAIEERTVHCGHRRPGWVCIVPVDEADPVCAEHGPRIAAAETAS